jgi:hypothetical protein
MPSIYTQVNDYPPSAWGYNYVDNLLTALPVKDVWAYPDIAVEANHILGVQVSALAQAVDYDVDIIMHNVCRSGGADYDSTSFYVYNWMGFFDFLYFSSIWEQNPDGPTDWLRIDFNAAEFGYEREELPA